jgi:hypothetical protein
MSRTVAGGSRRRWETEAPRELELASRGGEDE